MKRLRLITQCTLGLILGLYVALIFALDTAGVQVRVADYVETQLGQLLHTAVKIDRVAIGLNGSVSLHGVTLNDQQDNHLLHSDLIYAKMRPMRLLRGEVFLRNVALLDADIALRRDSVRGQTNFQFLIDAFTPQHPRDRQPDVRINSLLMRRCRLSYDVADCPQPAPAVFSPHHVALHIEEANLSLKHLSRDSLDVRVRQLAVHERSGLTVDRVRMRLIANRTEARLSDLLVQLPHSRITWPTLHATYHTGSAETFRRSLRFETSPKEFRLATRDLAPLTPKLRDIDETLMLQSRIALADEVLTLSSLSLSTLSDGLDMTGRMRLDLSEPGTLIMSAQDLNLRSNATWLMATAGSLTGKGLPAELASLGALTFTGSGSFHTPIRQAPTVLPKLPAGALHGQLTTDLGNLEIRGDLTPGHRFAVHIASDGLDVNPLSTTRTLPSDLNFEASAAGWLRPTTQSVTLGSISGETTVHAMRIGRATLHGLHLTAATDGHEATLHGRSDDEAARLTIDATSTLHTSAPFARLPQDITLHLNVEHLIPARLGLTQRFGPQGTLSFDASGHAIPAALDHLDAEVSITNLTMSNDGDNIVPFRLDRTDIALYPTGHASSRLTLRSDFGHLDYDGPLHPSALRSISHAMMRQLADVAAEESPLQERTATDDAGVDDVKSGGHDNLDSALHPGSRLSLALAVTDTEFIHRFLGIPLTSRGTIQAHGHTTADGQEAAFSFLAPELKFGSATLRDVSVYARNRGGEVALLAKLASTLKNGRRVQAELSTKGTSGRLETVLSWDESLHEWYGKVAATTDLKMKAGDALSLHTMFSPTTLCIGDSLWRVSEGTIEYGHKRISISDVGISHASQRLRINGIYDASAEAAGRTEGDTITVGLNDLDLAYALAFANFGVVEFGGHATGQIYVRRLPNGNPWARATLAVPDFTFNQTPFGAADIVLGWNHELHDITIQGDIREEGIGYTLVRGYVDPIARDLDLRTESRATPLGFLEKYTQGIFEDVTGRATGHCRIYGGFRSIAFSGHETGECEATIPVTGVRYQVTEADVDIVPDAFHIRSARISDGATGQGTAYGSITHEHIRDMHYDFTLAGTDLRLYDRRRDIDLPFYATATGSGDVHIYGAPGQMNADIHVKTSPGSMLTYILDSPDADASQLLTLRDGGEHSAQTSSPSDLQPLTSYLSPPPTDVPTTDINLYLEVDVEDQSALHLVTDDKSGDVITVYGSGPIQAHYHNKSGFRMYGIYNIHRGTYSLNIPSLAQRRRFEMIEGGRVQFSGDPMDAEVNVRAQYVVASASLADLNLGSGLPSTPTRVNCLVDIHGQVAAMEFDLDFALPNCSEDEQMMVRNLIASDEDRTMQVLYLLGVGRFYAYNYTGMDGVQSQSVMMMNSLLSSTLSSQLNNIIASAVGSSNWSFGTNISTGQLGWSDMEVEGLVSSRLLSGRLLLNGNFGYSERQTATTNFVGDFDVQYLVTPRGTVAVRAYSETNDRYFTKSTLTTQGVGLQLRRDFSRLSQLFRRRHKRRG